MTTNCFFPKLDPKTAPRRGNASQPLLGQLSADSLAEKWPDLRAVGACAMGKSTG